MSKTIFAKIKSVNFIFIFVLVISWVLLFINGLHQLDPDFGWHVTMGRLISENGIPKTDPFSYTMTSFPFVDHEWLTNVIIARMYESVGRVGLAAMYSTLVIIALLFSLWETLNLKDRRYEKITPLLILLPSLLVLGVLFSFAGIRPQVTSWFLIVLLYKILTDENYWKKWRYIVAPLMLLWTNLHGSFAVGIFVILLVFVVKSLRLRRFLKDYFLVFLASFTATFINPYRVRLWGEVWMQLSDTKLRWRILEWMPSLTFLNFSFIFLLTLSAFLVYRYWRRFGKERLFVYVFFLFQGMGSVRHVPLWSILTIPILIEAIIYLYDEVKVIKFGPERFTKLFTFLTYGVGFVFICQGTYSYFSSLSLSEKYFYPQKAALYLKSNLPAGQLFSEYGWGGYLIQYLPEREVFIDGRMPSWRYNNAPAGESNYAMEDYLGISRGGLDYKEQFVKYGIETVLWPKGKKTFMSELDRRFEKLLSKFKKEDKEKFNFVATLEKESWKKIYEDDIAVVYRKP